LGNNDFAASSASRAATAASSRYLHLYYQTASLAAPAARGKRCQQLGGPLMDDDRAAVGVDCPLDGQ
jgi:hypothetical protein